MRNLEFFDFILLKIRNDQLSNETHFVNYNFKNRNQLTLIISV